MSQGSPFGIMMLVELVALLGLSNLCLVIVVWLFLTVPWVCPQFVIVVFPYHRPTHLLFYYIVEKWQTVMARDDFFYLIGSKE